MTSDNESQQGETTAKQEARAELRESFLRELNELIGQDCHILTYEKSRLSAKFAGWNLEGQEILVRDLKTPSHVTMKSALLRTPDILAIQFDTRTNNNVDNSLCKEEEGLQES